MSLSKRTDILIVGDSITLGVAEARGRSVTQYHDQTYVHHLRNLCPGLRVEVDAATFRTTSAACSILPSLMLVHQPRAVLLMLGGNDADIDWRRFILSRGQVVRNNVSVDRFAVNLRQLARETMNAGAAPILVDVPGHALAQRGQWLTQISGQDVSGMIERSGGQPESDRRLQAYNRAVSDIASEYGVAVAGWARASLALPPALRYGPDHVHPGRAAHRVIAETLAPVLMEAVRHGARDGVVPFASASDAVRAAS